MPITVHWYDQQHGREHGLGRHIEHDSRSRAHQFQAAAPVKDKTTIWSIQAQPLNQGQVGSCHDPETEVLTRTGWLPFADLTLDNKLATVNPQTRELSYENPTRVIAKHYSGDMYYLEGRGHNFAVTADHMMLVRKWNERARTLSDTYSLVPMDHVGWYAGLMTSVHHTNTASTYIIPGIPGYKYASQRFDLTIELADWLRFLGIYLAEGTMIGAGRSPHKIQIAASKSREKTFVRDLLSRLGMHALELRDRFTFDNARIYQHMEKLGLKGIHAPEKFVPRFVFEQSSELIECLLEGHREGDGSFQNGKWTHYTASPQLADDLQELAFLAGYKTGASVRPAKTSTMRDGRTVKGVHPSYCVSVLKGSRSSIERRMVRVEHYDGIVYCAEVPTHHTLVTRRHGRILVSGNCTGEAPTQLVNTDFFTPVRKKVVGGRYLNQDDAYNWYHLNTTLDSIPGTWTPDDTGSSGLAAAKAGIKQGFFDRYQHAFGWNGFKVAIQHQPLIIGIPWAVEMDDLPPSSVVNVPDFSRISPDDIGGHELLANGIDFQNKLVVCFQSWGQWGNLRGVVGQFGIPFQQFQYLLSQGGDVVVPHGVGLP